MSARFRAFAELYLSLDRRVLGALRVGLGAVLLYDLLRRFPDAGLLWSSDGVLPSEVLRRAPQDPQQWSLLLELSSASSVRLAFVGIGALFLAYTLGLFTRWLQPLCLLAYTSLNARNLFFEDGGTSTVILLLGWTLLLPLGDRFSLDALRRDAACPKIADRVAAREAASRPVVTLAALALLLQAAVVYWFNAIHKSGVTWRSGDAVHLVLWQHRVNTTFALWLSQHEPRWFSPLATASTKRLEALLPVLLLWPSHPKLTRSLAFVLALLLHASIALCLTLGPFSYAMICLVWASVPGPVLDAARERLPRKWWLGWARLRARAVAGLGRHVAKRAVRTEGLGLPHQRTLCEVALGFMLLVETGSLLTSNRAVPKRLQAAVPHWLAAYKPYLRGFQGWSMFAPDAPRQDGTLVVDAVRRDGRHVDPFTGTAPDPEGIRRGLAPHSIALSDYFFAMRDSRNARYRRALARYLQRVAKQGTPDQLVSAEFIWVSYEPPPRGSQQPGPLKRESLWKTKLTR